uniref:OTU domain-containing protein n=1 Tax=Leptobrachium leishanense TaxID=445787 RepID=A0A8C5QQ66_9ANUR
SEGFEEELTGAAAVLKQQQQRREKKELQAKIQSMKNSVPKNKKRRKQLTDDIVKLEAEMEERHKQELDAVAKSQPEQTSMDSAVNGVTSRDGLAKQIREQAASVSEGCATGHRGRGASSTGAHLSFLTGAGHLNQQQHTEDLQDWLTRPSSSSESFASQACSGVQSTSAAKTSNSASMSTATPFEWEPNTGVFSSSLTANTPAWGGQLELRALSHILQAPIEVIQADSPLIVIGEEYSIRPITLVYMRQNITIQWNHWSPLQMTDNFIIYLFINK